MYTKRLSSGVSDLVNAFMGGGGARGQGSLDAAKSAYQYSKADEASAQASIAQDRLAGRKSLAGMFAGTDIDPAQFLAADNLKGTDVANAQAIYNQQGRLGDAVDQYDAGNVGGANFRLQAAGEDAYDPFVQNANGSVLNKSTGVMDESSRMALSSIAAKIAQAGASSASAANSYNTATNRDLTTQNTLDLGASTIQDRAQKQTLDAMKFNRGDGQSAQNKPNFNLTDDVLDLLKVPSLDEKGNPIRDFENNQAVMEVDRDALSQVFLNHGGQGDVNQSATDYLVEQQRHGETMQNLEQGREAIKAQIRNGAINMETGLMMINALEQQAGL